MDYAQVDVRLVSKIARKRNTLEVIRENIDSQTRTVRLVIGEDGETDEAYTLANGLNFGLWYGMGFRKLQDKIEADLRQDGAVEWQGAPGTVLRPGLAGTGQRTLTPTAHARR